MKKTFSARRVPRKIGVDEEEESNSATPNAPSSQGMSQAHLSCKLL
jgi:hypothetical protein